MTATERYNVTQWGIENPAGALMHETLADDPVSAWTRFREWAGHRQTTLQDLEERGYVAVRVAFVRVEYRRLTKRGDA